MSPKPDFVWGNHPGRSPRSGIKHEPRHKFDCTRCKFSWCCGTLCDCILFEDSSIPDAPPNIALKVELARLRWRIYERKPC